MGTTTQTGAEMIAVERQRQIDVEGYTAAHDEGHASELLAAAACYLTPASRRSTPSGWTTPLAWPWGSEFWKPTPDDRSRELVKAGALIAAAIDSLKANTAPTEAGEPR